MYLAFIHIGRYDIKARRHLACVQNGITQLGDWRMETWQLALRARCHVSIRQSPSLCNAILSTSPCLLAIWRNYTKTLSALLAHCDGNPPVTSGFPSQRTSNACFHVFNVSQDKRLNKQSSCRWFDAPWRSLWRQSNDETQNNIGFVMAS